MTHPQDTPANPAQGVSARYDSVALEAARDIMKLTQAGEHDDHLKAKIQVRITEAITAAIGAGGQAVAYGDGYCTDCESRTTVHNGRCSCGSGRVIMDTHPAPSGQAVAWLDDGSLRSGSHKTAHRVVTDEQKRDMPAAVAASFTTPLYLLSAHSEQGTDIEAIAKAVDPDAWADNLPVPTRADTIHFHERRRASCETARRILSAIAHPAPSGQAGSCLAPDPVAVPRLGPELWGRSPATGFYEQIDDGSHTEEEVARFEADYAAAGWTGLRRDNPFQYSHRAVSVQEAADGEKAAIADQIIGQIEERFPNWRSYRDLIDCIDCTLHALSQSQQQTAAREGAVGGEPGGEGWAGISSRPERFDSSREHQIEAGSLSPTPSSPGVIETRNEEVGFIEFVNSDVPYFVREIDGNVAIIFDMQTCNVIGYRVYDPAAAPSGGEWRQECATEGCAKPATVLFERGGVGLRYCHTCYMRIQALPASPAKEGRS